MRKAITLAVCSLLLAAGWTGSAWAQGTPAQRLGLRLVDNKSTFDNEGQLNHYENVLGLYQLNDSYPFTAGMLNDGDNSIVIYRQAGDDGEFAPAVRINLQAQESIPEPTYLGALSFTNAPSSQTTVTADMLPEGWGTTTGGLIWQTNGSAYIAAQGGLTYTIPQGYSNVTVQVIAYVGSDVRGGYFTTNLDGLGWYVGSEVSAGGSYIVRTFYNVNSGQTISIYGGESGSDGYYLAASPDITQIGIRLMPDSYLPLMTVTPTASQMGDEGWGDESPLDVQPATLTVNDLVDLDALQVSDTFDQSTADNDHPASYRYKAELDANIEIPEGSGGGMDYYASADFAAATSSNPATAAFVGENNWSFYNTTVYSPSAGQCAYMTGYGRIVYRMPASFMGSSVDVTMTSSTGDDGAGEMYVNGVLHNFNAGETYTWTVPVTAGGAIELRGIGTTFSIDFTRIVISSGNGTPTGAPRHDTVAPESRPMPGIDGKPVLLQPLGENKTESNSPIKIND